VPHLRDNGEQIIYSLDIRRCWSDFKNRLLLFYKTSLNVPFLVRHLDYVLRSMISIDERHVVALSPHHCLFKLYNVTFHANVISDRRAVTKEASHDAALSFHNFSRLKRAVIDGLEVQTRRLAHTRLLVLECPQHSHQSR
jgi:hypothetical protein